MARNGEIKLKAPTALSLNKKDQMSGFLGEYSPNITEGSRITLPKKLRKYIRGAEVVLSKGFEKCIFIYNREDWMNSAQKQVAEPREGMIRVELERYLYTSATESPIDVEGRIVIPANLLKYAEIDKETSVLGVGDHIEVWSEKNWEAYSSRISGKLDA